MFYLLTIFAIDVVAVFFIDHVTHKDQQQSIQQWCSSKGHTLLISSGLHGRHEFKLRKDVFHVVTLTHNLILICTHIGAFFYEWHRVATRGYRNRVYKLFDALFYQMHWILKCRVTIMVGKPNQDHYFQIRVMGFIKIQQYRSPLPSFFLKQGANRPTALLF